MHGETVKFTTTKIHSQYIDVHVKIRDEHIPDESEHFTFRSAFSLSFVTY